MIDFTEINWNKRPSDNHFHDSIIKEMEKLWKRLQINGSDKWSDDSTVITDLTVWDNMSSYGDIL